MQRQRSAVAAQVELATQERQRAEVAKTEVALQRHRADVSEAAFATHRQRAHAAEAVLAELNQMLRKLGNSSVTRKC